MNDTKSHIVAVLQQNLRFDGRKNNEFRKVSVAYNISSNAEGSASVKIGETEVFAGVKMMLGSPYPDTPDQGALMVNAELTPMSSPEFEAGPPDIRAIELARVVDRGIRESKAIDMKKLLIKEGEKCWIVSIDLITVNNAGNLLDASALAALAALKVTRLPKLKDNKVDYKELTKEKLPLQKEPISVTVLKIGSSYIVDPTVEEEEFIDARLTVATTEDSTICALQKGGDIPLTMEDVEKMMDLGAEKAKELRKAL